MRVVTLATWTRLPQARVLAASLHRHQPEWPHDLVLIAPERQTTETGEYKSLGRIAPDLEVDVEKLIACHDEPDLIPLVLPPFLASYSAKVGSPVLHLPATTLVTGDLGIVIEALSRHSVMLVRRTSIDVPDDGLGPSPTDLYHVGRISDMTMAVDGGARAQAFLTWWGGHTERMLGSLDGKQAAARAEDRPWLARMLELAPARFMTAVLEHPGCNASMWNLQGRSLEATPNGVTIDGQWPLRFMDLTGFEPEHPYRLSATASRVRVSRSEALRALCAGYAGELLQAGWKGVNKHREVGRSLANGLTYDEALCSLYRLALMLGERFEDPFGEDGSQAFTSWLQGPAPRGGAHGITRYVFYRVLRERPDVMRVYPDLDGKDGAGYVGWCWVFGREEMGIPECFMPPLPPELQASGLVELTTEPAALANRGIDAPRTDGSSRELEKREHSQPVAGLLSDAHPSFLPAVRVSGYLGHALGLGAAARGYVQALAASGVRTSTASVTLDHMELPITLDDSYGRHSFDDMVHDGLHAVEIVAVNPDELPAFVERVGEDYFRGPRVGIWGWETNSIPARWQRSFALVDEIWVYSRFMAENIGAATLIPVIALPPPVQSPTVRSEPLRLGIPNGYLFLFMFDYLSTIQRKNPVGLIEAFKRAFLPGEGPQLLVKTINGPLRPLSEEALLWAAHGRTDIHVVDCSLEAAERDGLVAACDCYVSLHRSEGFGLTMAEAMAVSKPVIGTGYSGNLDFMNAENSYLVDYEIGRVGPDCEIYPADGEWAEPSVEHASELMRHVVERPNEAADIGARAREDIARMLSPEATGAVMRRRLEALMTKDTGAAQ
jgi:glycosyltransferase involved in cell wall biosynthesis